MEWTSHTLTEVLFELANLDDVFACPQEYVDSSQDIAILRLTQNNVSVIVMIGTDDETNFYIVLEDNETSQYFNADNQSLKDTYIKALKEWNLIKWFNKKNNKCKIK